MSERTSERPMGASTPNTKKEGEAMYRRLAKEDERGAKWRATRMARPLVIPDELNSADNRLDPEDF